MSTRMVQMAAAALIVAGILIGISSQCGHSGGSVAFGEVIQEMQQVKAVTWTEISDVAPPEDPCAIPTTRGGTRQCAYKAPGHERQEGTSILVNPRTRESYEYKSVNIMDRHAGRGLLLDPQSMTACPCSWDPGAHPNPLHDLFLSPPQNTPPEAQSLGTRPIDGRAAVGFRLLKKTDGTYLWSGDITDIWVDVNTRRLITLETRAANGLWAFEFKDFVFHEDLDDSLFSLDPPAGYTLTAPLQFMSLSTGEENQ